MDTKRIEILKRAIARLDDAIGELASKAASIDAIPEMQAERDELQAILDAELPKLPEINQVMYKAVLGGFDISSLVFESKDRLRETHTPGTYVAIATYELKSVERV